MITWKQYDDIEFDDEIFPQIGADFEKENKVRKGTVGSADARCFNQREAVEFAEKWLAEKRKGSEE